MLHTLNSTLMKSLVLKNLITDSSSSTQGILLFQYLQKALLNKEIVLLHVDSDMSMSPSFLNSSIGQFLDEYGLNNFKNTVKFKGSKNQFARLSQYITKYSSNPVYTQIKRQE